MQILSFAVAGGVCFLRVLCLVFACRLCVVGWWEVRRSTFDRRTPMIPTVATLDVGRRTSLALRITYSFEDIFLICMKYCVCVTIDDQKMIVCI